MGLGVEYVLIQTDQLAVVREQEEEILQRLAQEETLHLISGCGVHGVTDVTYGGVPPAGDLGQQHIKKSSLCALGTEMFMNWTNKSNIVILWLITNKWMILKLFNILSKKIP